MGREATEKRLTIADLRGGRNGTEPPLSLPDNQCVGALNVDWYNASLARKRAGCSQFPLTGAGGGASPITGVVSFLGRHVPDVDETTAQLFVADESKIARWRPSVGGLVMPAITDPMTGAGWDIQAVSFKGKYIMAYQSAKNRLHCFVDDGGAGLIRPMGLASPGTVTAADTGSGTYQAVARAYRARVITQTGGVVARRSEPGGQVVITPSGSGSGVLVTFVGAPGEGETHWELEVSPDSTTFFLLATVAIGTTTYVDTSLYSSWGTLPVSQAIGTFNLQGAYRFVAVDGNRILGFGNFNPNLPQSRLEYSGITGSTNMGDDERVPIGNYLDLDEADSGAATGLAGPVYGSFYLFKYRQVWKLTPTGNAYQPYSLFPISKVVGAINQNSIDVGEDALGNPVIYFLSTRGVYRLGLQGLEYVGLPIEDLWLGPTKTANLGVPPVCYVSSHAVYHSDKRQMWFWYASIPSDVPDTKIMYDVVRSAWVRHEGQSSKARCSVMFPRVVGGTGTATTNSRDMKPYVGFSGQNNTVFRCDDDSVTDDAGFPFQAYILTKPYVLGGMGAYCTIGQGTLTAEASPGVTISQTIVRDFGKETQTANASIAPVGSETRVQRLFDGASMSSAWAVQFQIGDLTAISNRWRLDAVTMNYIPDQAAV